VRLILFSTLVILAATYAVLVILRLVLFRKRPGKTRAWYWRVLQNLAVALPLTLLLLPVALGFAGSRLVHTRRDEASYQGPRFAADGTWVLQSRESLAKEPQVPEARHAVSLETADGLELRAFLVPAKAGPPTARVVMVHGLFRGALELEPVASMFRDLGAEVLMLELRNHGGSARAPASYGLRESEDVLAASRFMQQRPSGDPAPPLVLFGVSLGTAAVALAAPRVEGLKGLVLDSPMTDLRGVARRVLAIGTGMPGSLASTVLWCIEAWSGFSMDEVDLRHELPKLSPDVQVLVIGAGQDRRCPPAVVREVFDSVKGPEDHKELWILETARHGRVWEQDGPGYRQRLARLLARIRGSDDNR
jgi:pimeloyl-ACP methyl ester carboxylesterase